MGGDDLCKKVISPESGKRLIDLWWFLALEMYLSNITDLSGRELVILYSFKLLRFTMRDWVRGTSRPYRLCGSVPCALFLTDYSWREPFSGKVSYPR